MLTTSLVRAAREAVAATGLLVALSLAAPAAAQPAGGPPSGPVGPTARPAFSPYLNLARYGASPALNYYGLVRPQTQLNASVQALQSQASLFNPYENPADQAITTGNPFGYQNYQAYFQNQYSFSGTGGGGRVGSPVATGTGTALGGAGQRTNLPQFNSPRGTQPRR